MPHAFDRIHPALQHHIVNSLGWRDLRPLQTAAIDPILDGCNVVAVAPTAAGKTEAAVLPLLSAMLSEDWRGLSVLYVCPLRALLNNLHVRIDGYASLLGRRAGLWHGDVRSNARRRIIEDAPDLLLTTPESLEVMLMSTKVEHDRFFRNVHAVVVDEIHAFGGDDRGWHLLAVLERISRVAQRDLQRIGLSATVGDPAAMLAWLTGSSERHSVVVAPTGDVPADPHITLDHVGSLDNAAAVITQMHRGEKRLVFCDSRARVEALSRELRARGVTTFLSHGSLAFEERRRAEEAFSQARDCVIVSTSTLELGIDVGDLDRVIQIDSPGTVASFLQRLGRTGRRSDTVRNALLLTTKDDALLQAAGLLHLWSTGFVEPVVPPPMPVHLLAQQLLALVLQRGGVGRNLWQDELRALPEFAHAIDAGLGDEIAAHLVATGMLVDDGGVLTVGPQGENSYGFRHFMDLTSAFTSDPLFVARHGATEIGFLDPSVLLTNDRSFATVLLAGHAWKVVGIDWNRHTASLMPSDDQGQARWLGSGSPLSGMLSRAMRDVLAGIDPAGVNLSRRAVSGLAALRADAPWVARDATTVVNRATSTVWWTFAGLRANTALRAALAVPGRADNLCLTLEPGTSVEQLNAKIASIDTGRVGLSPVMQQLAQDLKFADCLPAGVAVEITRRRFADPDSVRTCLDERRFGWHDV